MEVCYTENDELYHYGVKGMKWGVRKEYEPVGRNPSAKKKSRHRQRLEEKYRKKGMGNDEAEKAASKRIHNERIAVGAAFVATVLAAYGTYKLADSGDLHRLVEKGKAFVHGTTPKWKRDDSLANRQMDAKSIYDNVVLGKINPGYGYKAGTANNCRRCTFAYEMRRRGFDVSATKTVRGTGQTPLGRYNATHDTVKGGNLGVIMKAAQGDMDIYNSLISNPLGTRIVVDERNKILASKSIFDSLSSLPDRSRGELSIGFKSGKRHSMAWEIIDGKPIIYDCQTSEMYDTIVSFWDIAGRIKEAGYTRLDNVSLNNDFLLKWLTNSDSKL